MAEASNPGSAGPHWASGFVSEYSRGAIVPTTKSVAETPQSAETVTDSPGVVSAYTRGSIVPETGPDQTRPDFQRGGEPMRPASPERGKITPIDTPRLPAPRLEMGGAMGQTVRNGIRNLQRTENRVALDKAYGANAVKRMMAMPLPRRAVEMGDDFKQAMPKPKRRI